MFSDESTTWVGLEDVFFQHAMSLCDAMMISGILPIVGPTFQGE